MPADILVVDFSRVNFSRVQKAKQFSGRGVRESVSWLVRYDQ